MVYPWLLLPSQGRVLLQVSVWVIVKHFAHTDQHFAERNQTLQMSLRHQLEDVGACPAGANLEPAYLVRESLEFGSVPPTLSLKTRKDGAPSLRNSVNRNEDP